MYIYIYIYIYLRDRDIYLLWDVDDNVVEVGGVNPPAHRNSRGRDRLLTGPAAYFKAFASLDLLLDFLSISI